MQDFVHQQYVDQVYWLIFSHLFLENLARCVCVFWFFSEWLGKVFSPKWFAIFANRWSRFGGLVRDEQINLGWQFMQIWMLPHDPWEWTTRSTSLDSFKVFLLFCTMDSLPSRSLQEGMIFLVHLEPKHLTSKSTQVILRCFFLFVDIFRLGQICSPTKTSREPEMGP